MEGFVLFGWQEGTKITWGITSAPTLAKQYFQSQSNEAFMRFTVLTSPLPYWLAEKCQIVLGGGFTGSLLTSTLYRQYSVVKLHNFLRRFGVRRRSSLPHTADEVVELPGEEELNRGLKLLQGRILIEQEAKNLLASLGENLFTSEPETILETLLLQKRVQREANLFSDGAGRWHCRRCGSVGKVDIGPCNYCGRTDCAICTECASLGVARSCQALVKCAKTSTSPKRLGTVLKMPFTLSPPQQSASKALIYSTKDALIWAACGAGKTEVVFPLIEKVLNSGGDVLFAIPRRDIVIELEERLKTAFPQVSIKALYGGVENRYVHSRITIATTHQVLRFYQRFNLVILDEVDAFPYKGNQMLHRAIKRVTLPFGHTVYLTATPTDNLLQKTTTGELELITIPARYHRHRLPVPELVVAKELVTVRDSFRKGNKNVDLSPGLLEIITELIKKKEPLLVFVPAVNLVTPTARLFDSIYRSGAHPLADALPLAAGIHSREPRRDAFKKAFAQGELPVLVATTVMERGVTVPGVNVVVLWAEVESVFDSPTLIQMAGRAGRTKQKPRGNVYFIGSKITMQMETAKKRITQLNEIAQKAGYIDQ